MGFLKKIGKCGGWKEYTKNTGEFYKKVKNESTIHTNGLQKNNENRNPAYC